ncbi:MAG: HD-GYP domain-containing protein [Methylocystaceae bacterium]
MRAIPTLMLKPGTIISQDIYSQKGQLLLPKGKSLTEDNIRSLMAKGIEEIYTMEDPQQDTPLEEAYQGAIRSVTEVFAEAILDQNPDQKEIETAAKVLVSMAGQHSVMNQIRALFVRGNYLFKHSVNVAFFAITLGKWLKLPDDELTDLGTAALLHDIGMAGIPDYILDSPEGLNEDGKRMLAEHPQTGVNLLSTFPLIIQKAVLQHHERMDGSGYPYGISGEQINLYARIIAISDVFDAMTSARSYRAKMTPYEAITIIRSLCFKQLDPSAGIRFCTMLVNTFIGDQVLLNNGKTGEVIWVDAADPTHMLIRTKTDAIVDTREPSSPQVKEVINDIQSALYE